MDQNYIITMEETREIMKQLSKVFDVVRLLEAESLREIDENNNIKSCDCYEFWNRRHRCDNCVSQCAISCKGQRIKLEYLDQDIYEVIAKYLEIDGKGYSLEMLIRINKDVMSDPGDCEKLVMEMTGFSKKLYEDVLTGAYNRRYYEDKVKNIDESAGLAVIDLDDFKIYNDTFGHSAGDMALITAAKSINECIRSSDMLIRYGGDEFLLVMPGIDIYTFRDKLRQIQKKINEADVPGYTRIQISVSIGGVVTGDESIEQTVSRADNLMYKAKKYKNVVVTELDGEQPQYQNMEVSREKILIVDDSDINRDILAEILQDDYQILEAHDGAEGIDMIERYGEQISLVLLDILMPGIDGFGVLSRMKEDNFLQDIPVIMISTEDSDETIRRAYDMGASDYISRPFDSRIVYRRVNNIIKLYLKQRRLMQLLAQNIDDK